MKLKSICDYCGEEEATKTRLNPNDFEDEKPTWRVCQDCDDTINAQMRVSFGSMLLRMDDEFSKEYGEKQVKEATAKLKQIAERSGKESYSVEIDRMESGKYEAREIK